MAVPDEGGRQPGSLFHGPALHSAVQRCLARPLPHSAVPERDDSWAWDHGHQSKEDARLHEHEVCLGSARYAPWVSTHYATRPWGEEAVPTRRRAAPRR